MVVGGAVTHPPANWLIAGQGTSHRLPAPRCPQRSFLYTRTFLDTRRVLLLAGEPGSPSSRHHGTYKRPKLPETGAMVQSQRRKPQHEGNVWSGQWAIQQIQVGKRKRLRYLCHKCSGQYDINVGWIMSLYNAEWRRVIIHIIPPPARMTSCIEISIYILSNSETKYVM